MEKMVNEDVLEEVARRIGDKMISVMDQVKQGVEFWNAVTAVSPSESEYLKEMYQIGWRP